jgi:hypothetical protein
MTLTVFSHLSGHKEENWKFEKTFPLIFSKNLRQEALTLKSGQFYQPQRHLNGTACLVPLIFVYLREIGGNWNRLIQVTQDLNPSFSSSWFER